MSLKKIFISLACLGVFAFCVSPAAAMTVDELQAKIAELMAQITQLQQQLAQQTGTKIWCHTFNTNLKYGDTGTEVTALTTALNKNGVSVVVKNKFDEGVGSAVVEFQEKYISEILTPVRLAHGNGFVGKLTRSKLNNLYGCKTKCVSMPTCEEGNEVVYAGIDPQGCETWTCAPLKKSLTLTSPNGGEQLQTGKTYDITWNASGVKYVNIYIDGSCMAGSCSNGACTAPVCWDNACMPAPPFPKCMRYSCNSVLIAGQVPADTGKYSWTVPANESLFTDAKIVVEEYVSDRQNQTCLQDYSNNKFSIVAASTNLSPVIDSISGPTQLNLNQTGTWTIKAHDPENGTLNYQVKWGDEWTGAGNNSNAMQSSATQTTTFTHSYSNAGIYTVEITVTDDYKNTAKSSTTVNVATKSFTLTSPNGGEQWQVGKTYNINWNSSGIANVNITLQTYSLTLGNVDLGKISIPPGEIASNVSASSGKYSWTVPIEIPQSGVLPYGYSPVGTSKQIVISDASSGAVLASSNSFAIVAGQTCNQKCQSQGYQSGSCQSFAVSPSGFAARDEYAKTHTSIGETSDCYVSKGISGSSKSCYCNSPTLTLASPNGGEQWVAGKTYNITWSASGVKYVNIYLEGSCVGERCSGGICSAPMCTTNACMMAPPIPKCWAGCYNGLIAEDIDASLGKYSWTIPTNQSLWIDARIMIEEDVSDRQNQTCLQDYSNNKFSIVAASTNLSPVIDSISGPTQLNLNQTGTWTIKAHDPENGTLNYQVKWGDEWTGAGNNSNAMQSSATQTTTFTHSYSNAGIYTVEITVTDDYKNTAKSSTTVTVPGWWSPPSNGSCGWCGDNCTRLSPYAGVCAAIAPPIGFSCVDVNGVCTMQQAPGWSSYIPQSIYYSSPQSLNTIENQLASIANAVAQLIEKFKSLNQ